MLGLLSIINSLLSLQVIYNLYFQTVLSVTSKIHWNTPHTLPDWFGIHLVSAQRPWCSEAMCFHFKEIFYLYFIFFLLYYSCFQIGGDYFYCDNFSFTTAQDPEFYKTGHVCRPSFPDDLQAWTIIAGCFDITLSNYTEHSVIYEHQFKCVRYRVSESC